jgi:WD40 repeat protein
VGHATFSPDGRLIVTTTGDTAYVWDATTWKQLSKVTIKDD